MATSYLESTWPSDRWPNFSFNEIKCKQTGACIIDDALMDKLQEMRSKCGPLRVTSAYRSPSHTIEAEKIKKSGKGGAHTTGRAIDIACDREKAYNILGVAMELGFTGIGVKQSGDGRFLHLDIIDAEDDFHVPRPTIWSY